MRARATCRGGGANGGFNVLRAGNKPFSGPANEPREGFFRADSIPARAGGAEHLGHRALPVNLVEHAAERPGGFERPAYARHGFQITSHGLGQVVSHFCGEGLPLRTRNPRFFPKLRG